MQTMIYHTHCHRVRELKASTLTDMLASLGAFKEENTLVNDFTLACEADSKGRTGHEQDNYPQADYLLQAAAAARQADTSSAINGDLQGSQIGEAIRRIRIKAVSNFIRSV